MRVITNVLDSPDVCMQPPVSVFPASDLGKYIKSSTNVSREPVLILGELGGCANGSMILI